MERREFLALLGASAYAELAPPIDWQNVPDNPKADITIRISPVEMEVAQRRIIKTTAYNGSATGPVLRLREGQPVTVDVFNDTKIPELVHWRGLFVPSELDGSEEEGTPIVPPGRSSAIFVRPASLGDPLVSPPRACRPRYETRHLLGTIQIPLR